MRFLPLLFALLLTACASRPAEPPVAGSVPVPPPVQMRSDLVGLTSGELVQRFGVPAFQVREGAGLKLQFRNRLCVLDTYLYPPVQGAGPERVTHVDARLPSGSDTDQLGCIAALQGA